MSVIRVQAFRFSFINYLATIIAAISTLWIYPLEWEAYGLAQLIVAFAAFCIPLATIGTFTVVVKFFPEYKSLGLQQSYLFNLLVLGFGTLSIAIIIAVLINHPVVKFFDFLSFNALMVVRHKYVIVALIAIMLYNGILALHASNHIKIVVPSVFQNLLPKLVLPVLILGVYMDLYDISVFARLWVMSFCIVSVGLTLYLWHIRALDVHPQLTFFTRERLKPMLKYSSYMGVGTIAGMFAGKLDLIMVGTLAGLKETGIYGISLFIANVLTIPATGVWQIASPVISDAFKNHNWERIKEVYTKSSTNLLLIGVIMYFIILGTLEAVFSLSSRYHDVNMTISLFMMIGLAKLMDMGMGVNQIILTYSAEYRIVSFFVILTAVLNITMNYFLITSIGILGAALATCITTYVFQLLKYTYVAEKFGIQPFSRTTPKLLLLFIVLLMYYIVFPDFTSPILEAVLYCAGLVCIYIAGIRLLRIESDVTEEMQQKLMRLFRPLLDRFS